MHRGLAQRPRRPHSERPWPWAGVDRASLHGAESVSGLAVKDATGELRAILRVGSDGIPALLLQDQAGNKVWGSP